MERLQFYAIRPIMLYVLYSTHFAGKIQVKTKKSSKNAKTNPLEASSSGFKRVHLTSSEKCPRSTRFQRVQHDKLHVAVIQWPTWDF